MKNGLTANSTVYGDSVLYVTRQQRSLLLNNVLVCPSTQCMFFFLYF